MRNNPLVPSSPRPYTQASSYPGLPSQGNPRVARERRRDPLLVATILIAAGMAALILLVVTGSLAFYAYYQVSGRIIPGVQAGGMPLGGMSVTQAAAALHQVWNVDRRIVLADGLHTWEVPPATLGLHLDPAETAGNAFSIGHNGGFLTQVETMLTALWQGWEIIPAINLDIDAARQGLQDLSNTASLAPRDATFTIQNGQVVPVPGELGYIFNLDETLARLAADPRGVLRGGLLQVSLMPVPPRVQDVSTAITQAQRLLDTPVIVKAYDPVSDETLDLSIPRETVGTWLRVSPGENGPQVALEPAGVEVVLEQIGGALGPERFIDATRWGEPVAAALRTGQPTSLVLSHHPTTYAVQPGDTLLKIGWKTGFPYWVILNTNPGLDPEKLWAGQNLTLPSKDELLPLPVVPGKRIVIGISAQKLWAYENGEQVAKFVISTGIDRSPTQPGIFQVQTHERSAYASVWDLTMPDFLGIYEAWPGFMNGIHGLPTLSNGRRLWANILGRPASYGCIILDLDASAWLYDWAEDGVVVEIRE